MRLQSIVLVTLSAGLFSGCPPASLSEAFIKQKDTFPDPYYVVLPMSSDSRLGKIPGTELTEEIKSSRRMTTSANPCFFVAPSTAKGISRLEVAYKASKELQAEMSQISLALGADLQNESEATFVLSDIKIVSGVGVPDLNSPCRNFFKDSKKVTIFTSQAVAGSASLDFSNNIKAKLNGSSTVQPGTKLDGALGWEYGEKGTIQAKDIIIGGQLTEVKVNVAENTHDLGTNPSVGQLIKFPTGFEGNITIKNFQSSTQALTVRVNAPLMAKAITPPDFKTCQVGSDISLAVGDRCDFWLSSGSSLVSLQWNTEQKGGVTHVVLAVTGYGTNFTANPGEASSLPGGNP